MSPDAHKNDGKPVLNTMLPVVLLTIHTLITIVPGPVADAFGGMYHNQPIQSIVKSILSIGTLIVFLMAHEWMRRPDTAIKQGEFYILTLSTLLGMYFMISAVPISQTFWHGASREHIIKLAMTDLLLMQTV